MKASFLIIYAIFSSTFINAKIIQNTKIKRNYVKKLDYKRAINLSNKYALKGDMKTSYKYAKIAYNLSKSKESMYILGRIYNYQRDYGKLLTISNEILKKDKKDYLGLKYKTIALIEQGSSDALNSAKKGYMLYGRDFEKLLDKAYNV
jgi:hypothetical protein